MFEFRERVGHFAEFRRRHVPGLGRVPAQPARGGPTVERRGFPTHQEQDANCSFEIDHGKIGGRTEREPQIALLQRAIKCRVRLPCRAMPSPGHGRGMVPRRSDGTCVRSRARMTNAFVASPRHATSALGECLSNIKAHPQPPPETVDGFPDPREMTDHQLVDLIDALTRDDQDSEYLRGVAERKVLILRDELARRFGGDDQAR